ncbi:MAG: hypothetical protein HQL51_09605 [Magnetococcales bacterium]|nr:hypothetical protein [Magnetococcales bacterium]
MKETLSPLQRLFAAAGLAEEGERELALELLRQGRSTAANPKEEAGGQLPPSVARRRVPAT